VLCSFHCTREVFWYIELLRAIVILARKGRLYNMSSPATSSNAIPIPPRKSKVHAPVDNSLASSSSYGSYAASTPSSSPQQGVKKRRESLMCTVPARSIRDDATDAIIAPSFSAASHTVINVGEESHPRLISCVKASQGFTWNQGTSTITPHNAQVLS
jgi:hypothetical protein